MGTTESYRQIKCSFSFPAIILIQLEKFERKIEFTILTIYEKSGAIYSNPFLTIKILIENDVELLRKCLSSDNRIQSLKYIRLQCNILPNFRTELLISIRPGLYSSHEFWTLLPYPQKCREQHFRDPRFQNVLGRTMPPDPRRNFSRLQCSNIFTLCFIIYSLVTAFTLKLRGLISQRVR